MFTDEQKVQILNYCGYPAFGSTPVPNFSWRYSITYGDLEFKINNLSTDEENKVINYYLPNLVNLENDIPNVRNNLDTKQAAVWHWNTNEIRDRWRLFNSMRRYLCDFIGAAYGPTLLSFTPRLVI